jgi:DNA ligase-1
MKSVIEILELLESNNSRLFKEQVLEENSKNELLKKVFVAVGDPYNNFYINKFKMPTAESNGRSDNDAVENFLDFIVNTLSTRKITGNAAKDSVVSQFSKLTQLQQKWCQRIILKNLRCGVQEATINKTWPNAIVGFSVQLAESLKTHHDVKIGIIIDEVIDYPVRVEPKLDGLRCIIVKNDGNVTMFTRSGSVIETLPQIKNAIEKSDWDNFVLDGEVMGSDWNESASVVMSYKSNKNDSNMFYHVFDAMAFDDWRDQQCSLSLLNRISLAAELIEQTNCKKITDVFGETVNNEKELLQFYANCMSKGYEGIMIKKLHANYSFKRSDAVVKMKPVATYEGMIVGHYLGNRGSKREGLWGGFEVVMSNGIITRVGGGYTDKLKSEIGIDPNAWIGKIVEVEGQPDPMTKDGLTKDGKVRFPVFLRERDLRDVDQKIVTVGQNYLKSLEVNNGSKI